MNIDELRKIVENAKTWTAEECFYSCKGASRVISELSDTVLALLERVEKAERRVSRLKNREQKAFGKLREAKAAIQRVRDLHQVDEYTAGHTIVRCVCEEMWPCATIRALEGDK